MLLGKMKRIHSHRSAWLAKTSAVLIGLLSLVGKEVRSDEEAHANGYEEPEITERDRRFWAFQPPEMPAIPEIPNARIANPVDAFLLEKLRESGIEDFASEAPPEVLLRRLSYTLTGLPPESKSRVRFLAAYERDPEQAWREAVDGFLDSPHYGERWAQHWLDVARFAETDGFEHDKVRSEAWRYRDWVIGALNEDVPFDRFVALQIAGDELEPESPETAVATGFLLAGPDMPDINLEEERRHSVLNEVTSAVGSAFLGLTMECAQCHDHRTDPISQADFYRMRALFESFVLPPKNKSLPVVFASRSSDRPESRLYVRGDFRRPGDPVQPGFPRVLLSEGEKVCVSEADSRVALANWLGEPGHPLTARVMMNRVWQHHFGEPLVGTPSDFGKLGDRPTHPELLDWLAVELIRESGSLKAMHRKILLSRAWRQSSRSETPNAPEWSGRLERDPDNQLLSRQNRRRLDGEAIRDTILTLSGRLSRKMGGPGVRPPLPPEVSITLLKNQWPVTEDVTEHDRRSIYLFARRNLRFPFFQVFDRPDANQSCARRQVSTTAPQALTLWNDQFVHEAAKDAADRLMRTSADGEIVEQAVRLFFGREPSQEEQAMFSEFLGEQSLAELCIALFNANEFVYLD